MGLGSNDCRWREMGGVKGLTPFAAYCLKKGKRQRFGWVERDETYRAISIFIIPLAHSLSSLLLLSLLFPASLSTVGWTALTPPVVGIPYLSLSLVGLTEVSHSLLSLSRPCRLSDLLTGEPFPRRLDGALLPPISHPRPLTDLLSYPPTTGPELQDPSPLPLPLLRYQPPLPLLLRASPFCPCYRCSFLSGNPGMFCIFIFLFFYFFV